jgi:hypothetical protein
MMVPPLEAMHCRHKFRPVSKENTLAHLLAINIHLTLTAPLKRALFEISKTWFMLKKSSDPSAHKIFLSLASGPNFVNGL